MVIGRGFGFGLVHRQPERSQRTKENRQDDTDPERNVQAMKSHSEQLKGRQGFGFGVPNLTMALLRAARTKSSPGLLPIAQVPVPWFEDLPAK